MEMPQAPNNPSRVPRNLAASNGTSPHLPATTAAPTSPSHSMSLLERQLAAARAAAGGAEELARDVPSVLLERAEARKTDLVWALQMGENGFAELSREDARFLPYGATLFAPEMLRYDRERVGKEENARLDAALDGFLRLGAAHAVQRPMQKALEWLVRRFHVHRYNVRALLDVLLPLHESQLFARVVRIVHVECVRAVSLAPRRARGTFFPPACAATRSSRSSRA
jgi:hypothetical protein